MESTRSRTRQKAAARTYSTLLWHRLCLALGMTREDANVWPTVASGFGGAFLGIVVAHATVFVWSVRRAHDYSTRAQRFERPLADASRRILIVGDSTAVGLGTLNGEDSIAGRLARDFPHASIENRAVLGARVACVLGQLAEPGGPFDAIIIAAGGNDVIRGTPHERLRAALTDVIQRARALAPLVIVVNSGNVGGAPLFCWPLNMLLSRRSLRVRRVFAQACRQLRAQFVNLTFVPERDRFARQPGLYFAEDGLHPSSAAYEYCYEVLRRRTRLGRILAA